MKPWYAIFISTFIIIYWTLSLALLGGWVVERVRVLRDSHRRPCRWKVLSMLLLALLIGLAGSLSPLHAGSEATVVNLRGDRVRVPLQVPPKQQFVLQRLISVDDRLIVFLYSGPKFQGPVEYTETYNLNGELLEIAWYDPGEGLRRARDINLGDKTATKPARILEIVREVPGADREFDRKTDERKPLLQSY